MENVMDEKWRRVEENCNLIQRWNTNAKCRPIHYIIPELGSDQSIQTSCHKENRILIQIPSCAIHYTVYARWRGGAEWKQKLIKYKSLDHCE